MGKPLGLAGTTADVGAAEAADVVVVVSAAAMTLVKAVEGEKDDDADTPREDIAGVLRLLLGASGGIAEAITGAAVGV
jgi:hypothetical protein